ncbi:Thioredoxin [Thalictrum thalictroides]|uniref:Thioredoxin n=1 Tax=Thalictrum thalictroides TaxID=46969 RepID=A0A7J6V1Y1_THATH|nr:Thioredoxin [Thalictrum thalictroides]
MPVEVVVGQVTEVNKDTFWPLVNASGDKLVVLDMYTQWCGPCKVIAPKYKELSEKHLDVVFLKLDCNQENKALAKELGLRVVPTFKILKDSKVVKEVTGAKLDDLVFAIETAKSSS